MRFVNDKVLSAADASVDQNGGAIDASGLFSASCSAVVTGTSTGTLKFQASNDSPIGGVTPTNWVDIPSATVAIAGAGNYLIAKIDLSYQWVRAVFVHTNAAAGTITAIIKASGF